MARPSRRPEPLGEQAPRSSGSRSTCRSSRRRGSPGYASCGSPSAASSDRMRPRPNSSGQGLSDSIQRVCHAGEGIELSPVARELLALRLDHLGLRVRDELLVREHPLAPLDLACAGARSRRLRSRSTSSAPGGRRRRRSAARRPRATATPLRRKIAAASWTASSACRSACVRVVRLRPGRDDQAIVVELRPDLLGHVRHDRMEQRQQPLERGERRPRTAGSPSRGLIASAYQSQKSSKVRR